MIKRKLYQNIIDHLKKPEISVITGPRQVGKTTLMTMIQHHLDNQEASCIYLNLDKESDLQYMQTQKSLLDKLRLEEPSSRSTSHPSLYVFIDEIQRKTNAGLFLKGLYDAKLPYKFIVSGSGSLDIRAKIVESLVGRKKIFQVHPISLEEFIDYRTNYKYSDRLTKFCQISNDHFKSLLNEYITYGGYPKVITHTAYKDKLDIIEDIWNSYVQKDINNLLSLDRPDAFVDLLRLLASQTGQLVKYSQLAASTSLSFQTLKKYLWYAEQTYIIKRVSPYFKNKQKEITKAPVYYFKDNGLRNFLVNSFVEKIHYTSVYQSGFLVQNYIFNFLDTNIPPNHTIKYWRTKSNVEVDFIIDKGTDAIPIEVKQSKISKGKIPSGLRNYIKRYCPCKAFVVNQETEGSLRIGKTLVRYVPFSNLKKLLS